MIDTIKQIFQSLVTDRTLKLYGIPNESLSAYKQKHSHFDIEPESKFRLHQEELKVEGDEEETTEEQDLD